MGIDPAILAGMAAALFITGSGSAMLAKQSRTWARFVEGVAGGLIVAGLVLLGVALPWVG